MGRSAHDIASPPADHAVMDERGTFHRIEDDLAVSWVEEWAAVGVEAIEEYLAKHLAFLPYLDDVAAAYRGVRRRHPPLRPSIRSRAPFGMAPTADACGS